jgi:hypothetical protein
MWAVMVLDIESHPTACTTPATLDMACAGALPVLFGIVVLLDDLYATSEGGRQDLVLSAGTAELQSLWVKALQQAAIPRPQLLARLHDGGRYACTPHCALITNHKAAHDHSHASPLMLVYHRHSDHASCMCALVGWTRCMAGPPAQLDRGQQMATASLPGGEA